MDRPTMIRLEAFRRPAAETPGVDRREAFSDDHVWGRPVSNRWGNVVRMGPPPRS